MMIGHLDKVEKTSEYTVTKRESFKNAHEWHFTMLTEFQWRNGFLGGLILETRGKKGIYNLLIHDLRSDICVL